MLRTSLLLPIFLLTFLGLAPAQATTVLQLDFDAVIEQAEVVFEGEVIASSSQKIDARNIVTHVTFRIDDLIKGNIDAPTITLSFAGGIVGDEGMRVSSMVYPRIGERGIYFVQSIEQGLIHPLVGWGQGHYRIERDSAGSERIMTEAGVPVMQVESDATPTGRHAGHAHDEEYAPFSHGTAEGLVLGNQQSDNSQAMRKSSFVDSIRAKLASPAASPSGSERD